MALYDVSYTQANMELRGQLSLQSSFWGFGASLGGMQFAKHSESLPLDAFTGLSLARNEGMDSNSSPYITHFSIHIFHYPFSTPIRSYTPFSTLYNPL